MGALVDQRLEQQGISGTPGVQGAVPPLRDDLVGSGRNRTPEAKQPPVSVELGIG
ncbi:MAG: hypothetical protein M1358_07830 [Chloroflexi bacterium]|nr:hypothetical protein [Chloroflexota bacterium]